MKDLKSVTSLMDGAWPFLGGEPLILEVITLLGGINHNWRGAGLPKNGWSPPPEDSHQAQRVVNNLKNFHKK